MLNLDLGNHQTAGQRLCFSLCTLKNTIKWLYEFIIHSVLYQSVWKIKMLVTVQPELLCRVKCPKGTVHEAQTANYHLCRMCSPSQGWAPCTDLGSGGHCDTEQSGTTGFTVTRREHELILDHKEDCLKWLFLGFGCSMEQFSNVGREPCFWRYCLNTGSASFVIYGLQHELSSSSLFLVTALIQSLSPHAGCLTFY